MSSKIFYYGKSSLDVISALQIADNLLKTKINTKEISKINKSRNSIIGLSDSKQKIYGVNTGFGVLCDKVISSSDSTLLQENLLKSHAVGVGENVPTKISKLMLIIKVHSLCMGFSGIRLKVIQRICWHIEKNIIPVVPSQGSVGASGDLAPLAHLFLPLIGEGTVIYKGKISSSIKVLSLFNKQPLSLKEKEGLALINGTQFITAYTSYALDKFKIFLNNADIISALSLESTLSSIAPFNEMIHKLRPHKGSSFVANKMRGFLINSEILESHKNCSKIQDPYSIRCIPQVHGASWDSYFYLERVLGIELNSVTDNPIVLGNNDIISGGNFHGQPIAIPIDYSIIAASELGNISDRRIYLLLKGNEVVPKLLMKNTGLNSGFMILQYTSAALVSENKNLCFPSSADSITTSLGQEDHVSMGSIGAVKFLRILNNLEKILALELICSGQAFDYHKPLKSGNKLNLCHEYIRSKINHCEKDKIFSTDIDNAIKIIRSNKLVELTS